MTKVHIISHTHWDREWYKPFEHFRVRLVYFMDNLINLLENNKEYKSFLFDAQTVILEDYLNVKPQNLERIKKLIKERRIIVGPWYIQPDEFSPDAESLIRNLIIGEKVGRRFGPVMKVGYLPDSFGHSCQLPQILKGFDIDSMVAMRGIPFYKLGQSEFNWKGLNGDKIIGVYLKEGYFSACFLPEDFDKADERILPLVDKLKNIKSTDNILIMDGIDHQWPRESTGKYINHLNQKCKTNEYIHSTLEQYVNSVKEEKPDLKEIEGDLITPENSRTHTSMASTRIYQKKKNREQERLVERYVEPIASLGWILGSEYPSELIELEWKYMIKNQAHDSICGCCTDRVHREIDERFESSHDIGETLLKAYSRSIVRNLNTDELLLSVFNNSMVKGKQIVNAEVILPYEDFELCDMKGNIIPYQLESIETLDSASLGIWASMSKLSSKINKVKFSFYLDFPFNFGYLLCKIVKQNKKHENKKEIYVNRAENIIENKFFKIKIHQNGVLDILDKESNKLYKNLNVLEDCGDSGDTYNYSPVKNDKIISSLCVKDGSIELIKEGSVKVTYKVKYNMDIPYELEEDKRSDNTVSIPVEMIISAYKDIKRVDIKTKIDNKAHNHRIRALFNTGVKVEYSFAETQFGVVKRSNKLDDSRWERDNWSEKPLPIYYNQKFVDVNDGKSGIAVLNKGLSEYEVYDKDENILAVTLLRGIGDMGKRELAIRKGRASGMEMKCPEAQCMGCTTLEYSIVPHMGDVELANICEEALKYESNAYCVQNKIEVYDAEEQKKSFNVYTLTNHIMRNIDKINVSDNSIIDIDNKYILISAIKKAEYDDSLILRIYNSSSKNIAKSKISINIDNIDKVKKCNLDERELQNIDRISNKEFEVCNIRPYTAVTLKVKFIKH